MRRVVFIMDFCPCVYAIKNIVNNKIYIGSTIHPEKRKNAHFNLLRKGKHHSTHLQRAFDIYGEECFTFEIIEIVNDVNNKSLDKLRKREKYYIDFYKTTDREYGYNESESTTNFSASGQNHPLYGKNRAELGHKNYWKGKKIPEYIRIKMRKPRSEQARENMRKNHADFTGKNNPMYGRKFTEEHRQKISRALKGRKMSEEQKEKRRGRTGALSPVAKRVVQLSLEGKFIREFESITEAAKQTNATRQHISKCCNGERQTCGGYKWKYADDYYK